MAVQLNERLQQILQARAPKAAELGSAVEGWTDIAQGLRDLDHHLAALADHPAAPGLLAALRTQLEPIPSRIDREILPRLKRVRARFERSTLNVGVAGEARVGKSTLLQAISGLGEGQIPTGDNLPVTAVRSRIFHQPNVSRATLTFHSWESFRDKVLKPYFDRLGWGVVPPTPRAFQTVDLAPVGPGVQDAEILKGMRDRVLGMQRSLGSYAPLLTGGTQTLDLDVVRPFVAYPTAQEELNTAQAPDRKYLAVREAKIDCEFPGVDVHNLGLIDLPGTGEIVAQGDDRHVAGLEDEVDLVILVSSPRKKAYWGAEAAKTLDLVRMARSGAEPGDFCLMLVNQGGSSHEQEEALVGDFQRKTEGAYRVLRANALDRESVSADLVAPVLSHLAERLPAMDAAAVEFAVGDTRGYAAELLATLAAVTAQMDSAVPPIAHSKVDIRKKAEQLREDLAGELSDLVNDLRRRARDPQVQDDEFIAAVDQCYNDTRAWLHDGLGRSESVWLARATGKLKAEMGSGGLVADELNRLRTHIAGRFNRLDVHLAAKMEKLWADAASIVAARLGVPALSPRATLEELQRRLHAAGCSTMAGAVEDLLATRLDYRTHYHPRMRQTLDILQSQYRDPRSGEMVQTIVVEVSADGAREALRRLVELGEKAAWEAQKALLQDLRLASLVLHASAEHFDDAVIRSGESEDEFHLLADHYRDEIWPGVPWPLDRSHGLFVDFRNCADGVRTQLQAIAGSKS
ncbi:MAG: hypothetical protein RL026_1204 [Pseudomonadota bacterium]|jgi:hypothetical protein